MAGSVLGSLGHRSLSMLSEAMVCAQVRGISVTLLLIVTEEYDKKQATEDRIYFDLQFQSGLSPLSRRHDIRNVRSA